MLTEKQKAGLAVQIDVLHHAYEAFRRRNYEEANDIVRRLRRWVKGGKF